MQDFFRHSPEPWQGTPLLYTTISFMFRGRWVKEAGGRIRLGPGEEGVEVSPTLSYQGEGLKALCNRKTFHQPYDASLQVRGLVLRHLPLPSWTTGLACSIESI